MILFLALLFQLIISSSNGSRSTISLNDFCRPTEQKCSQKNRPHFYQCDHRICARNQTKCNDYLRVEKTLQYIRLKSLLETYSGMTSHMSRNESEISILKDFKRFERNIKNCSPTLHNWQPTGVCIRGRHCFRKKLNTIGLKRVDCRCPKNKPYVCGSQKNYCSVNRQVCASFSYTNKHTNARDRYQLLDIKSCGLHDLVKITL